MPEPSSWTCSAMVLFIALVGFPAGFTMGVFCTGLLVATGRWAFEFVGRRSGSGRKEG